VIALTALVIAIAPSTAAAATGSVYGSAAVNRAHARAAATKLLGELRPGPGATVTRHAPGGRLAVSALRIATPNLVDVHQWFVTHRPSPSVLSFVTAHLPGGAERHRGGSTSDGNGHFEEIDWPLPAVAGVPTREVAVSVATLPGGRTGIRLDAVTVWLSPRPSWERVPPGVASVTFTGSGGSDGDTTSRRSRPVTVTGDRARRLAALVNQLQRVQPGVTSCPAGDGSQLTISFRDAHRKPLARAEYVNDGCPTIGLQVGGRTGPLLSAQTLGDSPRNVIGDIVTDHLVPFCRAAQLALAATVSIPPSGDGTIGFQLVNHSDDLCAAGGVPSVRLRTLKGHPLPTHQAIVPATVSDPPVLMFPDSTAQFGAVFMPCPEGPAVQSVGVHLPHGGGTLAATMGLIVPCNDTITVSAIS
jgi:hypothetical protein